MLRLNYNVYKWKVTEKLTLLWLDISPRKFWMICCTPCHSRDNTNSSRHRWRPRTGHSVLSVTGPSASNYPPTSIYQLLLLGKLCCSNRETVFLYFQFCGRTVANQVWCLKQNRKKTHVWNLLKIVQFVIGG